MLFSGLRSGRVCVTQYLRSCMSVAKSLSWQKFVARGLFTLAIAVGCLLLAGTPPAWAGLNDDIFEGNIYALYGGNGSLVPPRVSLTQSLEREDRATIMVFYVDDSRDCKQYATVVSQIQAFYGRAADILPYNVDAIAVKEKYTPMEPGYYYKGVVPQTVVLDKSGKLVYNGKGQVPYEEIDDVLREVYDLLPRSESIELKRRAINEFNTELAP